jgi:hypothetical protein
MPYTVIIIILIMHFHLRYAWLYYTYFQYYTRAITSIFVIKLVTFLSVNTCRHRSAWSGVPCDSQWVDIFMEVIFILFVLWVLMPWHSVWHAWCITCPLSGVHSVVRQTTIFDAVNWNQVVKWKERKCTRSFCLLFIVSKNEHWYTHPTPAGLCHRRPPSSMLALHHSLWTWS